MDLRREDLPAVAPRAMHVVRGYLVSDRDYVSDNLEAAVWFLEHRDELADALEELAAYRQRAAAGAQRGPGAGRSDDRPLG